MASRSSVMVMNTISTLMGGHALASPKDGRPCSLGTFNYEVAKPSGFPINLNTLIGPGKWCRDTQTWDMTIPEGYGATEKQQSKQFIYIKISEGSWNGPGGRAVWELS